MCVSVSISIFARLPNTDEQFILLCRNSILILSLSCLWQNKRLQSFFFLLRKDNSKDLKPKKLPPREPTHTGRNDCAVEVNFQ